MSLEDNKRVATEFFAHFATADVDGALGKLADDATWWIAGKPGPQSGGGLFTKEQMAKLFRRMLRQLEGGLAFTVKGAIAEGDQVALELESRGRLRNGRVYNNEYHILLTIRDGRIHRVREYLDTQHVYATWFQP
jgi:hypothetical protein